VNAKERIKALVESQPENATYDEIMRELVFARLVERGLADSRDGRVITNSELGKRIRKGFRKD
jgi:predicted transcriptional regulator